MGVTHDCSSCFGQPGGCGRCRGTGIEAPTKDERDRMLGDALRVLNNDGKKHPTFSVVKGGKSNK